MICIKRYFKIFVYKRLAGTYVLSGKGSNFSTQHNNVFLDPNKKYEAALLSFNTYHSIPNITKGKNTIFRYSNDNGFTWKVLELDTGSYEVEILSDEIQRLMTINGEYDDVKTEFLHFNYSK